MHCAFDVDIATQTYTEWMIDFPCFAFQFSINFLTFDDFKECDDAFSHLKYASAFCDRIAIAL